MLHSIARLKGVTIQATDGEIGKVGQFYFDDETWAIRYLIVEAGSWLSGRPVLISPAALGHDAWNSRTLHVALTKKKIQGSPPIDTQKPVSRQHEAAYMGYYGYTYYWHGPFLWGFGASPAALHEAGPAKPSRYPGAESADSHLRSTDEVKGYHIESSDGEVGHVEDFLVDDSNWSIRYLEVDTQNWWPGKKVLVSPEWIDQVRWADSIVRIGLARETIKQAPEYIESQPITRDFEAKLHDHYGRRAYWLTAPRQEPAARRAKAG